MIFDDEKVIETRGAIWEAFLRLHNTQLQSRGAQKAVQASFACDEAIDAFATAVARAAQTTRTPVMPQATINAPPLAPICYICGCAQTEEHAALPHNDYGVAWDRVPVTGKGYRGCCYTHISQRHAESCEGRRQHPGGIIDRGEPE